MAHSDYHAKPGAQAGQSVLCCLEDAGDASRSALEHAARIARRRHDRGRSGRLIAVVCNWDSLLCLTDFGYHSGGTMADGGAGALSPAVTAMVRQVAERRGIVIETAEAYGLPCSVVVRAVRAWDSYLVVLPALDPHAGRVARWHRRNLISAISSHTGAYAIDEYRPCAAPVTQIPDS